MSFRWTDQPNEFGTRGVISCMAAGEAVKGTHGTLSRFDVHSTLIAAGPGFRAAATDDLPTSNLDVAPQRSCTCSGLCRRSRWMAEF